MVVADGAAFHRERLADNPLGFGEDVRQRLQMGAALTSTEYALARRTQVEMRRRMEVFFDKYDLLLMPTTPIPALLIEGTMPSNRPPPDAFYRPLQPDRFTSLIHPVRIHLRRLPIGLQVVSKPWARQKSCRRVRPMNKPPNGTSENRSSEGASHQPSTKSPKRRLLLQRMASLNLVQRT